MPRTGQIIPSWLHPHEAVYINDNTRYEDVAFQNDGPSFLNVFMSKKGRDNKLLNYKSITEWVNEYGLPDYRRYGQPAYNAYVALSTGLAQSQSMRILPKDATHANVVLLAKYQKKDGKLQLKFVTKTVSLITDADDLAAWVDRMVETTPDAEGYLTLPLISFWSRGRGVYGNDMRVRISRDRGADKENNYVNYAIELLSVENGSLETVETYTVSFYIDAIDPNTNMTMFVNDVIDDENGVGSARFNCSLLYDNLEKVFDMYKEVYAEATNPEVIVEKVEVLPPTSLPDSNKLFINGKNEVWVFDADVLSEFKLFAQAPKKKDVEVDPYILPTTVDVSKAVVPYYIVSTLPMAHTKVFMYDDEKGVQAQAIDIHDIATTDDIKNVGNSGDLYRIAGGEIVKGIVEDGKVKTEAVSAIEFDVPETVTEGTIIANTSTIYKNTTSGKFYQLYKGGQVLTDISATCVECETLPSTTLYTPGTIYELTKQDGDKAIGSQWVYSEEEDMWVEPVAPSEPEPLVYTMENWDIFGYNKFTDSNDPYFVFDGGAEAIDILSIEGVGLQSGTDGSFSDVGTIIEYTDVEPSGEVVVKSKVLTEAERDEAIEQAYLSAFNGEFDKAIQSKRRNPVDIMLDANYPLSVKKAMAALALERTDCACHLDTNLITDVASLETFYTQVSSLNNWAISYDAHMMKTTDPITGKVIPVTMTLWMSSKIPQHFNVYGNHTPFAGEEYATLDGYQKNSIRPIIDADDHVTKELMYDKLHMNYVECIAENTYIRGTQQTSQNFFSDLSEENNVLVLLEIKRKIERMSAKNRYKWADPGQLRMFRQDCQEIFSSYQGTKCRNLEIDVKSNAWEDLRYIVHVYLSVVFRSFQKRAIIEIDVNPRQ